MLEVAFRDWLDARYPPTAASTRFSNVARVEHWCGDLDVHFAADGFASLLSDLEYTTDDERAGKANHTPIEFRPGSNLRNGLATLRSALRRYSDFRAGVAT